MRKWMSLKGVYFGCLIMAAGAALVAADTLIVGDSLKWQIPLNDSTAYSKWASSKTFKAGDTLVFNWTGTHDVTEVSKSDYNSCTKTPINNFIRSVSPVTVNLTSNSTSRYFICGVGKHCDLGQKVAITTESSKSGPSPTVGMVSLLVLIISMAVSSLFTYI